MSRDVVVKLGEDVSTLGLTRLTREKLYGRKKRVVVDPEGTPCDRALLTKDGGTLVPSSGLTRVYLTPEFDVVERSELTAIDPKTEEALEEVESTLGSAQELEGPIALEELLDCSVKRVYQLDSEGLSEGLRDALMGGAIYRTRFNYRAGYSADPFYLVMNEAGLFGLQGEPTEWRWCVPDEIPDLPEEADDDDFDESELDFEMF